MTERPNLERFSYLTLDDLLHPKTDTVVHVILITATVINTILLPLMIFVISKFSTKEMTQYKHLLILQLIFSYLFNFFALLFQPQLLWPIKQGFPGNTFIDMGPFSAFLYFSFEISSLYVIIVFQLFMILYRLGITFQAKWLQNIYGNTKVLYGILVFFIFAFQIVMVVPFISDIPKDPEEARRLTIEDLPFMAQLYKIHPRATGFHPALTKGGLDLIFLLWVIIVYLLPIIVLALLLFFSFRLRYVKQHFSAQNYSMQKMLFKSMVVQIAVICVSVYIPVGFFILTAYYEVSWGSYAALISRVVVAFNMTLESLTMIYFIKPYRKFVAQKFRNFKCGKRVILSSSSA